MVSFWSLDCFLQDTINSSASLYHYRKKMTMRKWQSEKNNYEYTLKAHFSSAFTLCLAFLGILSSKLCGRRYFFIRNVVAPLIIEMVFYPISTTQNSSVFILNQGLFFFVCPKINRWKMTSPFQIFTFIKLHKNKLTKRTNYFVPKKKKLSPKICPKKRIFNIVRPLYNIVYSNYSLPIEFSYSKLYNLSYVYVD